MATGRRGDYHCLPVHSVRSNTKIFFLKGRHVAPRCHGNRVDGETMKIFVLLLTSERGDNGCLPTALLPWQRGRRGDNDSLPVHSVAMATAKTAGTVLIAVAPSFYTLQSGRGDKDCLPAALLPWQRGRRGKQRFSPRPLPPPFRGSDCY